MPCIITSCKNVNDSIRLAAKGNSPTFVHNPCLPYSMQKIITYHKSVSRHCMYLGVA